MVAAGSRTAAGGDPMAEGRSNAARSGVWSVAAGRTAMPERPASEPPVPSWGSYVACWFFRLSLEIERMDLTGLEPRWAEPLES